MGLRQQILKNNGGQLSSTSSEELGNVAAARERPVPMNPLEAFNMTGNQDSAKMAGTAPNKLNAIRQSINDSLNQSTQARQRQDYQGEAAPEKKEKLAGLELAGKLEGRVAQLAEKAFQGGATQLSGNADELGKKLIPGLDSQSTQAATAALSKVAAGQGTAEDFAALAKGMGKTTLTQSDLTGLLNGSPEAVTAAIQKATPDTVPVSQLFNPDELSQMGGALGLKPQDMAGYTIKQLQDKVKEFNLAKMSETAKLQAMANSPEASPAERANARRLLAESGASGERNIEQDAKTLEQKISDGDKIKFMGNEMSIEDALSDNNIAGAVKRYFEEPGFKDKLLQEEPELAKLIQKNEGDFSKAVGDIGAGATEYNKIQEDNQSLKSLPDGLSISDDVMKSLVPGWGTPQTGKLQAPPILQALKSPNISPASRVAVADALKTYSGNPEIFNQLKDISVDDFESLGLNSKDAASLINTAATSMLLRDDSGKTAAAVNPDKYLEDVFGMGLKDLNDSLGNYKAAAAYSGDENSKKMLSILDANNDGKVDDATTIQKTINSMPKGNLKEYLSGSVVTPKDAVAAAQKSLANMPAVYNKVKDVMSDGQPLSKGQVWDKVSQGTLGDDDLMQLSNAGLLPADDVSEIRQRKASDDFFKFSKTSGIDKVLNRVLVQQDVAREADLPNIANSIAQLQAQAATPSASPFLKEKIQSTIADLGAKKQKYDAGIKQLADYYEQYVRPTTGESKKVNSLYFDMAVKKFKETGIMTNPRTGY